jgi:hypothetical protein
MRTYLYSLPSVDIVLVASIHFDGGNTYDVHALALCDS